MLINPTENEIIQSITQNCIEYWQTLASNAGKPKNLFAGEIEYAMTGLPVMMLNPLFDGNFQDPNTTIPLVVDYYKHHKIPMMWYLSPIGQQRGYGGILSKLGLEMAKLQVPGMAANLKTIKAETLQNYFDKPDITIRSISENLHEENAKLLLKGFNFDTELSKSLEKLQFDMSHSSKASTYLAEYESKIAATSSVFYSEDVAGIYDVSTLKDFRGNGLGTAVTAKCMLEAKEKGYEIIILQSSELGHQIYQKLGFKDYFIYERYLLRPEAL